MTVLSGADDRVAKKTRSFTLARASLCSVALMLPSRCLILDAPTFTDPQKTPPVVVSVSPNPREIQRVSDEITVSATIRSEDNGDDIEAALLIDYGWKDHLNANQPYYAALPLFPNVEPSDLGDLTPREVKITWKPASFDFNLFNCHALTLMIGHELDQRNCPVDELDTAQVTWHVALCPEGEPCPLDPDPDPNDGVSWPTLDCPMISEAESCFSDDAGAAP